MELSLPTLANEILARPEWIKPCILRDDPTLKHATIKHLDWSLPSTMTPDNNLFTYLPQHHYATSFTAPHILCNIPWNNNPSQLLAYLHQIADDWRCVQLFLQTFQVYRHILPPPPHNQHLYIQFPIAEHLICTHPLHPNDYIVHPIPNDKPAIFRLYYGNIMVHVPVSLPLPNRVPQRIIDAIRRLRQYHALPQTNNENYHQYPHNGMNALFTAPLTSSHHISQHTILKRKHRWNTYYPDIPMPMPQD